MKQIDHIGIAVKNLNDSNNLFEKLLNVPPTKIERVESQKLDVSFFFLKDTKVELLQPIDETSTISKFLSQKGEGIHHVAFEVEDIKAEMERLKNEGFQLLSSEPIIGANNKWVCFVHPKTANGVLVELCQKITE
jgi:methylmalonyl-CoA/ethylmalonyl-CoA epimerase